MLDIPGMTQADIRSNCRAIHIICLRNQEFEQLDIICCAAALFSIIGIYEKRHTINTMFNHTERQGSHTRIFSFLHSCLVRIRLADNVNRRNGNTNTELYDTGLNISLVSILLQKCISKHSGIPIFSDKLTFQELFLIEISQLSTGSHFLCDRCTIPSPVLQNPVMVLVQSDFFRQAFKER